MNTKEILQGIKNWTGDKLNTKADKTTTVNGHALSSNVTVSKSDVGLSNVGNFKAVSTVTSQGLSDTEKANARANIGAGTSSFSGSYNDLSNKPTIPAAQIQSDWNQTTTTAKDYIKNKPTIPTVPTNVSAFTNDAGYLTQHQDVSGKANKSEMGVSTSGDKTTITLKSGTSATVINAHQDLSGKQDKLVSGTNIKTINGTSVLGSGNISIDAESTLTPGDGISIANDVVSVKAGSNLSFGSDGKLNATDTTYSAATTSASGLMSSADKTKLNGIASGAEVNQNAFSNVAVGNTTISADGKTDTLTLVAGSNVTITPDATNDKVTIAATDTTYSAATTSAAGLMSADDKTKLNGIASGATKVTTDTVSGWGYTKNAGTVTGVKMNGTTKSPSSGVVDLGTVITSHQDISGKADKTTTVNGHALSSNVTVSKSDVGLSNVGNFKAVSTVTSQGLSDTEKANARANIGAGTSSFSGSYNDLSNKPTIPAAANNGTLTIQKNGTDVQTFTANQSTNATANITVPTKVSELTNDSGFTSNTGTVTSVAVKMNGSAKGTVTTSGTIDLGTVITSHQDISGKQDTLVSGTNIKTINNQSLLGSGNIVIEGGGTLYDAEVEYIESSTGAEVIDTGIKGTNNTSVYIKSSFANTTGAVGGIGANIWDEGSVARYGVSYNKTWNVFYTNVQSGYIEKSITLSPNTPYEYELRCTGTNATSYVNGSQMSTKTISSFTTPDTICPFFEAPNTKIYAIKIWENNVLVRDLIPVRVGQVGYLYDKVSGELFGNSGTGSFVLGQDKEYLTTAGGTITGNLTVDGNVGIGTASPSYKLHVNGEVGATNYNNTSDIRKKDIVENLNLDVEDIAKAPIFKFSWLDPEMPEGVNIGTSAQYWKTILPELVSEAKDDEKTLAMQYGVAGLASSIALARKVVEQEETIKAQEARIKALEDAIANIQSKLNN